MWWIIVSTASYFCVFTCCFDADTILNNLYPNKDTLPKHPPTDILRPMKTTVSWRPVNCQIADYQFTMIEIIEKTKWTDTYIVHDINRLGNMMYTVR
jgi:hypothetical protein